MAAKKVGTLIKEARTDAGMTQEELARRISGLSASDISLAERGQKELTQAQLKQIAKATGVTQASLINAAKGTAEKKAAKKTTAAKKTSAKKTATGSNMKVTAAERKLLELYREADSDTKKTAMAVLKGEKSALLGAAASSLLGEDGPLGSLLGDGKGEAGDALGSILEMLGKAK